MFRTLLVAASVCAAALPMAATAEGRFVVRATDLQSAELRPLARRFEQDRTLQQIADDLNGLFVLPRDVGIRLMQCDEPNAFYDPELTEIQLCLEIIDDMAGVLRSQFDHAEHADALAGAFISTALHEAGHALVDVLDLPITGREEDVVDQLSAWLLIEAGEAAAVLGAAATYYTDVDADPDDLSGEHALDRQRYFNHVCWVFGSDPASHAFLLDEWELPAARADVCEAEYRLIDRAWTRLLKPYLRGSPQQHMASARRPVSGSDSGADTVDPVAATPRPASTPSGWSERSAEGASIGASGGGSATGRSAAHINVWRRPD